jgi:hypothetical protein
MEGTEGTLHTGFTYSLRVLAIALRAQADLLAAQAKTIDAEADRIERGEWGGDTPRMPEQFGDEEAPLVAAMLGRVNGGQVNDTDGIAADVSREPTEVVKQLQALCDAGLAVHDSDSREWYPTGKARAALAEWRDQRG